MSVSATVTVISFSDEPESWLCFYDGKEKACTGSYIHYIEIYLQGSICHLNKYKCVFYVFLCVLTGDFLFNQALFTFSLMMIFVIVFLKVELT